MRGPGSIPSQSKLQRLVTLQSFGLYGSFVPQLEKLIHVCFELIAQGLSMTLKMIYAISNKPTLLHKVKWQKIMFFAGVNISLYALQS